MGIVPPKMVFTPARGDAQAVLKGAPFTPGPDSTLRADFRKKVGALQAGEAEKTRLVAAADAALIGPFRRGYDVFFALLDEIDDVRGQRRFRHRRIGHRRGIAAGAGVGRQLLVVVAARRDDGEQKHEALHGDPASGVFRYGNAAGNMLASTAAPSTSGAPRIGA